MFASFFTRPFGHLGFAAYCCTAAATIFLACLLYSKQAQSFAPPLAHTPPPEYCCPQTFHKAVPGVGLISEVQASGPALRALAATWSAEAVAAVLSETADGLAGYAPPPEAAVTAGPDVPDPESAAR